MNLLSSPEFKVGVLVLTVAVIVAVMSMRVSEDPSFMGSSQEAWFVVDDANGLVKNSAVKTSGIDVGVIKDIRLTEKGLAHIDMSLRSDLKLYESARIEIRASGILGDRYVEIIPGSPSDPIIKPGGQIKEVEDRGSLDALINEVGKITGSLGSVVETLQKAVEGDGDRSSSLGRIVNNIEVLTEDIAQMTSENKADVRNIVSRVSRITETLDEFVNAEGEGSFKEGWSKATKGLARIDNVLKNAEEITDKINRGEGTIGRLVNDEKTVDELNSAIEGVNSFLDSAASISTSLDYNSVYLGQSESIKSLVGIRIQPGLDRYYDIQVVDDPEGVTKTTQTTETTNGSTTESSQTKTFENELKFTILFAKNFYNWTLKGGMIENTGGFGLDYHFLRRRGRASLEFFDFGQTNVRASLRYNPISSVYVVGGVEDAANNDDSYSNYLGAGIFLTNDDLKLLLSGSPF